MVSTMKFEKPYTVSLFSKDTVYLALISEVVGNYTPPFFHALSQLYWIVQ